MRRALSPLAWLRFVRNVDRPWSWRLGAFAQIVASFVLFPVAVALMAALLSVTGALTVVLRAPRVSLDFLCEFVAESWNVAGTYGSRMFGWACRGAVTIPEVNEFAARESRRKRAIGGASE